ncbi:MAG: hypothetical protein IID33_01195 [Planctomycetes bacterium]|nr:hypothetical protein [Planctomycetota bacterium]
MTATRSVWVVALATVPWLVACTAPGPRQSTDTRPDYEPHRFETISLLGRPLQAMPPSAKRAELEADLAIARRELTADPNDLDKTIWVGRRLGYLWRMDEAIEHFSKAIETHPAEARLYRHRGHRYISARRFDDAIADLERAAELIRGKPDVIEQDGMPNDQGIPLTTTGFNVWYHLGLARYSKGDFAGAFRGFRQAQKFGRGHDDNLVATTDWMYMALRRLGRDREAADLLDRIHVDMNIIENHAYHRRLLMYKGEITPDQLLDVETASDLDLATLGYGLGNWHLYNGDREKANAIFRRVTSGPYWSAFGYIAAEAEQARPR